MRAEAFRDPSQGPMSSLPSVPFHPVGKRGVAAALLLMVLALPGCSSSPQRSSSVSSSPTPSPDPAELSQSLSEYAGVPCAMLDEQQLTDFEVTVGPQELDLSEGPATACYWVVSTGIQFAFVPYPRSEAMKNLATKPASRYLTIAGYDAFQSSDKDTCYQNIPLGSPDESFTTMVSRIEPDAPKETCKIATSVSKLFLYRLKYQSENSSSPSA